MRALRTAQEKQNQLHLLAQWLRQQEVEEVAMESTAQYWKPVWGALEQHWQPARQKREGARKMSGKLHLCQAKSNRGRRGCKNDFADGERLIKRLVAQELVLSFVPDAEQRLWRTVMRRKYQLTRDKVRFQNQLESLLERAHIQLSSLVSDLRVSARRMLKAIAEGETDPAALAALAMALEELKLMEEQIEQLEQEASELLQQHQGAVQRVAAVPGFGVDSAMQAIAEVGPEAAAFETYKNLSSWVGGLGHRPSTVPTDLEDSA